MTSSWFQGISPQSLKTVLEQTNQGLLVLDKDGLLIYCSAQAAELLQLNFPSDPTPSLWPPESGRELGTNHRWYEFHQAYQDCLQYQDSILLNNYHLGTEQSVNLRLVPVAEGVAVYLDDLIPQSHVQARLRYYDAREQLLVAIDQRIRQSVDLEEILNTVGVEIRNFLKADRVLIYCMDSPAKGKLMAQACQGERCLTPYQTDLVRALPWQLYGQKSWQPIYEIADIYLAHLPPPELKRLEQLDVRARLMVPIFQDQQLWGFLAVHQCNQTRPWQPLEILLLKELVTQIAIAIHQSELYRRIQTLNADLGQQVLQRTAQLEQAIEREAMLKRITDRVRDSLDEKQILQQAVKELALALEVGSCNAALYNLESQTSTIYYDYATTVPTSQGRVARMGNYPELYRQLLQNQCFQFCSITPSPVRGRVVMLACPIFDNEGVLGDLWLVKQVDQSFGEAEIRFVQQVASQCAIALRQARLYQAAQAQVAELEELNSLKDNFLSTVSHELRTPMTNLRMAILMLGVAIQKQNQLLDQDSPKTEADNQTLGEIRERVDHYLQMLRQDCEREIQLINDLLDLQRLEAKAQALHTEPLKLEEWLLQRVELFRDRMHERQQILNVEIDPHLPPLTTDATGLGRIVSELLNNACKYTPPGGEITLQVHTIHRQIRFQVSNTGVEIAKNELPRVFDRFYRIASNDPWKQGGTGLGLALVKELVQHLGGTIQADSENQVTYFRVDLPLELSAD